MTYCTCGHVEASHGPRGCYLACKCQRFEAGEQPDTPEPEVTSKDWNAWSSDSPKPAADTPNSPRALATRLRSALTNRELESRRADNDLRRLVEEVIEALDE